MLIFADTSRKKCWSQHNHANFLMKIKNSYDILLLYIRRFIPTAQFCLWKISSDKFAIPPKDTMVKYPPSTRDRVNNWCGSLEEKYKVNNSKNFSRHIKDHSISTEYQSVLLSKP